MLLLKAFFVHFLIIMKNVIKEVVWNLAAFCYLIKGGRRNLIVFCRFVKDER